MFNKKNLAIIALILCAPFNSLAEDVPYLKTEEQFIENIYRSFQEKNETAFLELYCWDNVKEKRKRIEELSVKQYINKIVKEIRNSKEIPQAFLIERIRSGIRYYPNLRIEGIIEIEIFKESNKGETEIITKPYGYKDNAVYFTYAAEELLNWSGPDDKPIRVILYAQPSSGVQPKTEGYFVYNVSGIDNKQEFNHIGANSWSFNGQYVKECVAKKISENGRIKLLILEGLKEVFHSDWEESGSPICFNYMDAMKPEQ